MILPRPLQAGQVVEDCIYEILYRPHLTGAVALGAGLDHAVGRAGAMTGGEVFNSGGSHFFFTAEGGLLEGQLQPGTYIFAPAGGVLGAGTGSATAAAEEFAEDVA